MCLLGLDIGTSGCKATAIDSDGNVLASAYQDYALVSPQPGWQEIDPELIWQSVKTVISKTANNLDEEIQAIGASSFGEAVVAVDRSGRSLGNSMMYIDQRGLEEADYLCSQLGNDKVLSITGTYVQPMYSICKILWMKRHRPQIDQQTWKYLLIADFILFKLGASPATDYSLAARTMAFDIVKKDWSSEILDCAGIDRNKFADPVQSGTIIGSVSPAIAVELGLSGQIRLVAGGHDQPCAALGAGAVKPGQAVDGLGTTECITPVFSKPILDSGMADNFFASVPHVLPGLYVTYAFTFTSGSVLKWYRNNWGQAYQERAKALGVNALDLMIDDAAPGLSPVMVLPHFAGAATPYMDNDAKGAIVGLTIDTRPEEIIKGILEGITFEIMINVERLERAGVTVNELMAVGGLSRSPALLQLKSSMMGKRIHTLNVSEAGTLGVAILAGTACGVFSSTDEAVRRLVKTKDTFTPDPDLHESYLERFETYKKLYPAIRQVR